MYFALPADKRRIFYKPYYYGPFSEVVQDAFGSLQQNGFISYSQKNFKIRNGRKHIEKTRDDQVVRRLNKTAAFLEEKELKSTKSISIQRGARLKIVVWALIQRITLVSLDGLRLLWCLKALGVSAVFSQAAAFVVGGVIGSAVSIVPAGLGIREGVSAGLAPLVGLVAASGFMAAALNRILALSILAPVAFILGLTRRK